MMCKLYYDDDDDDDDETSVITWTFLAGRKKTTAPEKGPAICRNVA